MADGNSLIEAIARALAGPDPDMLVQAGNPLGEPADYPAWMLCQPKARAAIAAITKAGFVCVPRNPTPDMIAAGHEDSGIDGYVNEFWPEVPYRAMITAAQGDGE